MITLSPASIHAYGIAMEPGTCRMQVVLTEHSLIINLLTTRFPRNLAISFKLALFVLSWLNRGLDPLRESRSAEDAVLCRGLGGSPVFPLKFPSRMQSPQ